MPQRRGVASRVRLESFPLRASRLQLQRFCDEWFNNHVPAEVAVFRPAFPIVFCTTVFYDEIGDEMLWKTGTIAQSEVYFLVPLDRYRMENGDLQFVEHCATTPYIFVDNAVSAITGRERFGFPKQDCRFNDPTAVLPSAADVERHLTVAAWEPDVNGHRLRPLLDIVEEPVPWLGSRLDRPVSGPVVRSRLGLVNRFDILWLLQTLAGEFKARTDPGPPGELKGQFTELLETYRDGLGLNLYNLRQFAHPTAHESARYQDLVRCRFTLRGVQDLRLLTERQGAVDFSVLLSRTAVVPIVERLGLQVYSRQRGPAPKHRQVVDQLRAYFPWYGQADVELSETRRLCWRLLQTGWLTDDGRPITPRRPRAFTPYNTYLGPSAGAFLQPQPTGTVLDMKLMMLPARVADVNAYLQSIVPTNWPGQMTPLGAGPHTALRVLASRSRPRGPGEQEGLLWLDGHYASIAAPVVCRTGDRVLRGMFLLHDFTNNSFRLQSLRELAAAPSAWASFRTMGGDWFGATHEIALVQRVDSMVIDRSASEALLTEGRLFDVFSVEHERYPDELPDDFGAPLREALGAMMTTPQPVLSFGSIPAPGNPSESVEQRLVMTELVDATVEQREPDPSRRYYIHFHESETFPLVKSLGLVTLPRDSVLSYELRYGESERTDVVPVIDIVHATRRADFARLEILWEQFDHLPRTVSEDL